MPRIQLNLVEDAYLKDQEAISENLREQADRLLHQSNAVMRACLEKIAKVYESELAFNNGLIPVTAEVDEDENGLRFFHWPDAPETVGSDLLQARADAVDKFGEHADDCSECFAAEKEEEGSKICSVGEKILGGTRETD